MNCNDCEERQIPELYLLHRLTDSERDEFEEHYFECAACFSQLQTCLALRDELLRQPLAPLHERAGFFRPRWTWALAGVAIVLLFAVGIWWYSVRKHPTEYPALSTQGPTQPEPRHQPTKPEPPLDELARVQPLPYRPVVLRGVEDQAHEEFHQAMQHYSKGEYRKAIPGLRSAVKDSPQNASFDLYLGVSYLLTGQTDSAIESLRRVISLGDPSYAEPAHFYLAKAYLREEDVPAAIDELQATVRLRDSHQAEAGDILRRLGN